MIGGTLLTGLLSWVTGDLTRALERAYIAKQKADTDEKKLAADERINALKRRQEVILKAQGDPFERFVRIFFAMPFVIYIWKVVVYDKVFSLGATDPLSTELSSIMAVILGGYFVDSIVRRFR